MIYFAQFSGNGIVKIGYSRNIDSRIRQLEADFKQPLVLLATIEGGLSEEKAIHERFSHLRIGTTEQFRPAPELMEFVGRPLFANECKVVEVISSRRPIGVNIKGSIEWRSWLEEAAAHSRMSVSAFLDIAASRMAKAEGFMKNPPER